MIEWLEVIWRILQVALGIGFVIFVHELGHFLVAKRVGIRVETFSLGFGPRLLGFRRGDTDYRISAVPLGGYVKMAGENPDELPTGADDEFAAKSVGARAAVIVAGVCMNAIFAVFAFLVAFKIGVRMEEPAVGAVQQGSAAERGGLRYGDRIVKIGGERPLEFLDLALAAAYASGPIEVVADRAGTIHTFTIEPRRATGSPIQQLGFGKMVEVRTVAPGSAAERAGLRPGDWIVGAGGKPINGHDDFIAAVRASPGRPLPIDVLQAGKVAASLVVEPTPRPARTYGMTLSFQPAIVSVLGGSAAEAAGLEVGDVIVEAAGEPADIRTLKAKIVATAAGASVRIAVERRGERKEFQITPRPDGADPKAPGLIGIIFRQAVVASVAPGSPAANAGIAAGDRLASGTEDLVDLDDLANTNATREYAFPIVKKGADKPTIVKLVAADVPDRTVGDAGVEEFAIAGFTLVSPGIVEPVRLGLNRTYAFTEQVILTLRGIFSKRIDKSTIGGPIGIATAAYAMAEHGAGRLLYFLAIISVNLAVLNIFPIPILDGGHLVFLGIEKLKGSPVRPAIQAAAQRAGLALLLALMIFVTWNDISRLLPGG